MGSDLQLLGSAPCWELGSLRESGLWGMIPELSGVFAEEQ